jgi:hypothetical protein
MSRIDRYLEAHGGSIADRRHQEEDREGEGESFVASPVVNGEPPARIVLGPGHLARRCSACHGTGGRGERYDCSRCAGSGYLGVSADKPFTRWDDPWARVLFKTACVNRELGRSVQKGLGFEEEEDADFEPVIPADGCSELFDILAGCRPTPCQ